MCDGAAWWVVAFAWVGAVSVLTFAVMCLWILAVYVIGSVRWNRTVLKMSREWQDAHRPRHDYGERP